MDLFRHSPQEGRDRPSGIVGMTVSEETYGGGGASGPPIVEFLALGTAITELGADDPRHAPPKPRIVVSLDR